MFDSNLKTGSIVLIGFGLSVAVISLIGFIGSCCKSSSLLDFYGLLMVALLIANFALFYYGYRYQNDFNNSFDKGVRSGINNFENDQKLAYALQYIQNTFQCCGWNGPDDYFIDNKKLVPASCCKQKWSSKDPFSTCSETKIEYNVGCKNSPVIEYYFGRILYSAFAIIMIQLIIILGSCCLARQLKLERY